MKKLLSVFTLVFVSLVLVACGAKNTAPTFSGVTSASSYLFLDFDPLAGVTANDAEDGDLTASIEVVTNTVDTSVVGTYSVKYSVSDSKGLVTEATRVVSVVELDDSNVALAQYLSGVDLSKLPVEDKAILFSAAEQYLIENVAGGVPLYTSATRVMYAERVQLFSPTYNGVLGFGTAFSSFSQDDSHVKMYSDTYGTAGEYTWRSVYSTDPTTLNQWISDDSSTSDFINLFTGALYDFYFDETKSGYEINPSLASAEPVAVDPVTINGKVYAKVWQIPVRDGLTWKYHPSTNVSGLPAGHEVLNAEDFLATWRYALTNQWFRARTGGGDFVSEGVKNAAEFLAGSVSIDQVGLRLAAGQTNVLEVEFVSEKSAFDVKYEFSSTSMSPVNLELMESLGEAWGTTPATVASSGVYYLDTWTPGQLLIFKKNTLHPQSGMYNYTGQQFRFLSGQDQIFEEFLAGRLESASVPSARVVEFASDPRVKVAPAATTWRMVINGFGTVENRDAYIAEHPEIGLSDTFVPEPILQYLEMKQALYYGFDRYEAAVNVVKTYLPAYTMFASTYFLDGESGISVRTLPAGAAILTQFGAESYGYFPDAARALFKQAVDKAIAAGYYTAGTAEAYTEIEFILTWASSGNTSAQAMVANLVQQYENILVDSTNFVRVKFTVNDVAFPTNYYNFMMIANTDLGIGGIQGSLLDAPSFLDVFTDTNAGGFTLDWGIDTHTPNISVAYHNADGVLVTEKWSYNALVAALNGKVYVKDGLIQENWDNADALINAYLDMSGEVFASSSDGAELASYVLGSTVEELAAELGIDAVVTKIVVTESGANYLFVIEQDGSAYSLNAQLALATDAHTAIQNYISANYGDYELTALEGPFTDAQVAANAYIAASYGYTTVAEAAADNGTPAQYTEVYGTTWDDEWSDAVIVLHIGDYYIGWTWL